MTNMATEDVLNAIDAALKGGVKTKVAFVNADCVNIATKNDQYRNDLNEMDWIFIDGIGMKIAGKVLNQPIRENVNGTNLFPLLCQELAAKKRSIFLLGSKPGVAQAVAIWAENRFPGLVIAGTQHGYFKDTETPVILKKIRESQADVLFVAMGAPKQELWINRYMSDSGVTLAMGVGGLFDYFSGNIPRAPMWMQNNGLEWVFRFIQEPSRMWRRYLVGNWVFLARIAKDKIQMMFTKRKD